MKLDLEQKVIDDTGKTASQKYKRTVVGEDGEEKDELFSQPITLGRVIKDCMMLQADQDLSDEEVILRGIIYDKVGDDVDFSKKEIEFIKTLIGKRYTPLFRWQLLRMLNQ